MIGAFRHLIELLGETRTPDAGGGAGVSYAPVATLWAEIDQLPSVADFSGDRVVRRQRVSARIRPRGDLVLGARLRIAGADYEIVSIETGGGERFLIIAEEVLS